LNGAGFQLVKTGKDLRSTEAFYVAAVDELGKKWRFLIGHTTGNKKK